MARATTYLLLLAVAWVLIDPVTGVIRSLMLSPASPPSTAPIETVRDETAAPYRAPIESTATAQSTATATRSATATASPSATATTTATASATAMATLIATATATATATPPARPSPAIAAATANGRQLRLPILMYHYVRVNPVPSDRIGHGLSVPPADFAAQLDLLASRGYQTVGFEEVVAYLLGTGQPPPARSVLLTFDDGYADAFSDAWPVLKKHGFRATIFMITGLIDRPGYLSWAQLRELAASGITIGSHTVNHPDLTTIGQSQLQHELAESRATLEAGLGRPVLAFSYPSGRYNSQVVAAVNAAGYRAAVTVDYGMVHRPADLPALKRVRVSGGQSLASIAASAGLE